MKLNIYIGEIIQPVGTARVSISYKDQPNYGDLTALGKKVDAIFGRDWLRFVNLDWDDIRLTDSFEQNLQELVRQCI